MNELTVRLYRMMSTVRPVFSMSSASAPRIYIVFLLLCSALVTPLRAQLKDGDILDRVEALAGREIVLKSEIDGQLFMLMQQNKEINPSDPSIRKRVLDAMINDKLVLTKALEDSTMQVSEDEINQQLEATVQQIIAQFGSEDRVEKAYGIPLWKIKKDGHDEIRKRLLMERMRQQKLSDSKVSRTEVEEFYASYRDSLPTISEQVELSHIVKLIVPASSAKEKAQQKARKIRDSIAAGGDFCDFAKRYSADPGTASSCGELSMRLCSDFVPEFCSAAKKLQINELSLPVETPFGFHVIQLLDRTKEHIHTRHILIAVTRQEEDVELSRTALNDIRKKINNKELSFDDAARIYSEEKETQGFGGALGKVQLSALDANLKGIIEKLKDGEVSEPIPYQTDRTKPAVHIVLRKKTVSAHKPSLESDYKDIERLALSFKQNRAYENWVKELRAELFWQIKE